MKFLYLIFLNLSSAEKIEDCSGDTVTLNGGKSLTIAIFSSLFCGICLGLLICPGLTYIRGKINKPTAAWEP